MTDTLTPSQQRAIETHDRNLLVSAAAGSGKTMVLAERCAYLACDAPEPCDVDQLLVVTFTDDTAGEMRKRISAAIARRAEASHDPRLARQMMLIHSAHISTLHGLGLSVLRNNFQQIGLDPKARLMNGAEAGLIRRELLDGMIETMLEQPENENLRRLIDEYAAGYTGTVRQTLLSLHGKLSSLIDPYGWLDQRRQLILEAIEHPLNESTLGRAFITELRGRFEAVALSAERFANTVCTRFSSRNDCKKYVDHASACVTVIRTAIDAMSDSDWDNLAPTVSAVAFERAASLPKDLKDDRCKAQLSEIKNRLAKVIVDGLFCLNEQQLRDGLRQTLWVTDECTRLIKNFESLYADHKRERALLDFFDLERLTVELLTKQPPTGGEDGRSATGDVHRLIPSDIAIEYRKKFRHVLVDEYQDINPLQDAILELLSNGNNLFVVGDVKQSIYRFRQGDPQRFISRQKKYLADSIHGDVIGLQNNYRTRGPLIDVLNGIYRSLMTEASAEFDYDDSHHLIAGASYPEEKGLFVGRPVELHVIEAKNSSNAEPSEFEKDEREAALMASRILTLLGRPPADNPPTDDGSTVVSTLPPPNSTDVSQAASSVESARVTDRDGTHRPIEPRDIVILLRTMKVKAERIATILRRAGIPVQAASTTGFFAATEVGDVLCTLRILDNARDDISLAAFLRSPLSGWAEAADAMAAVRLAFPPCDRTPCFHHALNAYASTMEDPLADQIRQTLDRLAAWRQLARSAPVAAVMWTILSDTDYLSYVAGLPDGQQRVANLLDLHQRAREFEAFDQPTLSRFLQHITDIEEEDDLGMPAVAGVNQNAVRVMSIHKSKGLEYPVVIVPDLGKAHNLKDAAERLLVDDSTGLVARVVDTEREIHYATIATRLASWEIRRRTLAEELRLLYVAGTRAKEHLILVGTTQPGVTQTWDETWSTHTGPIPAADVLACSTMLDWVGPAAAMVERATPGSIQRAVTPAEDVDRVAEQLLGRLSRPTASDSRVADLLPLNPPPQPASTVIDAIDRLRFIYPHAAATTIPATASVTGLTKSGQSAPAGRADQASATLAFASVLHPPRFLTGGRPNRAEIGAMTHLVLQRVDLARPCTGDDLLMQINALADRKFIRRDQIKHVDVASLEWFFNTDIGQRLRQDPEAVLREVDVTFGQPLLPGKEFEPAPDGAAADEVMIRGRLDAVLIEQGGLTVIDYKTDDIDPALVPARVDFYRPQINFYSTKLVELSRTPCKEAVLVFLTPCVVVHVEPQVKSHLEPQISRT